MAESGKKLPCDICDTHENVNDFCHDCRQNFCENCKRGHLRTSSTKDHRFAPIYGDTNSAKDTSKDCCTRHGAVKQFFCRSCSTTACTLCLKDEHLQHEFSLIEQYVGFTRFDIEKKVLDAEKQLGDIQKDIEKQAADIELYRRQADENVAHIKTTIKKWIEDLKAIEEEMIDQTQLATNEAIENVRNNMHELASKKTKYAAQLDVVKGKMRSCSDESLLEEKENIFSRLNTLTADSSVSGPHPTLSPVRLRQSDKEDLKEILQNISAKCEETNPESTAEQSDRTDVEPEPGNKLLKLDSCDVDESVYDIAPISESKTWVGARYSVMLLGLTGDVIVKRNHGMRGTSVARTTTGHALFVSGDSIITKIDQTGCVSEFIDIVSKKINYITSSRLNDDVFVATDQAILRLSHDGKIKDCLDCAALALTELSSGDIVAINDKRELVLLSQKGYTISKTSITWSWSRFFSTLTRDSSDRIIVGDPFGNQLYVYEHAWGDFELLKTYSVDMDNTGIYTITADKQDRLWIGTPWDGIIIVKLSD